MSNQSRHPAGTSVGGQWAPGAATEVEADIFDIEEPGSEYASGTLDYDMLHRSARRQGWGDVNSIEEVEPGIYFADCAGHGGFRLSDERNKVIPKPLRRTWYEEDTERHIVGMYHPDIAGQPRPDFAEECRESVVDYFPDAYEKATGQKLETGDSRARDEAEFHRLTADQWHLASALDQGDGTVKAIYTRNGDRRTVSIPSEAFVSLRTQAPSHGKHQAVSTPLNDTQIGSFDQIEEPPDPPPAPRYRGIDTSGLTQAQAQRANTELDKPIRLSPHGPVTSLRSEVERGHIESKYAYFDDEAGRMRYGIIHNDAPEGETGGVSGGIRVSKALWSSLEAPDERSESSKVSDQYRQSIHRENQAITRGDGKAVHAARKRSQRLFAQLKALREKRNET